MHVQPTRVPRSVPTVCKHRQKIERNAGVSSQSPLHAGPARAQEAPERTRDTEPERGGADIDEKNANPSINQTGHPKTKRNARNGRGAARKSEEENDGSGTEHDPLIAPGRNAEGKPGGDDHNSKGTQEELNTPIDNEQKTGGEDETNDNLLATTDGGLHEDVAGGDGGRFQGMRSRMKKAGKGFLPKKSAGSSARRRKDPEDSAPDGVGGGEEEKTETAGGISSGDTLPDAGGKNIARDGSGGNGDDDGGGQSPPGGPADDSDTARCACCC